MQENWHVPVANSLWCATVSTQVRSLTSTSLHAMESVLHLQDHLVSECRRSRESVFRGLKSFLELKRSGGKSHAVRNGGLSATATGPGVKGGGGREASKRHV